MIKLNNKNITYVALADSNNSIKAPKEIWYADSSNSVKLVYRRKDALIEGEDYEKYHFLAKYTKSIDVSHIDNEAYIDTDIIFDESIGVDTIVNNENKVDCLLAGAQDYNYGTPLGLIVFGIAFSEDGRIGHYLDFSSPRPDINSNFAEIENLGYNMPYYINGVAYNYSVTQITKRLNIYLFALNRDGNVMFKTHNGVYQSTPANIYIGKTTINQNDTPVRRFIPCKLLKPVPKWLDANGIRRQVGECGMIDLVSGKFYGNVNSVGTFTVENYYERKEWLIGDGSAVINTNIEDITNLTELYCYFYSDNPSVSERIFGREGTSRVVLRYVSANNLEFFTSPSNNPPYITLGFNTEGYFYADFIANQASTSLSSPTNFIGNSDKIGNLGAIHLFGDKVASGPTSIVSAKIKSFRAAPFIDLIPCTLTMDLPASMDANNIARTKGTSGMWDLVSDRFYGNVASSGTFKAVNLAEGVDYEVYDWLVGEINTQGTMMQFTIGKNFTFKRRMYSGLNTGYFYGSGYSYYTNTNYFTLVIWETSSYSNVFTLQPPTSGEDIIIESTTSKLTFNSTEVPSYCNSYNFIITSQNNGGMKCATSSITVDGTERYIPVKLLKSIPSTYDANGIARQAGECGMYDTVNDKFYGNVASSGSFTVSDDN